MARIAAVAVMALLAFGYSAGSDEVLTESDPTTTLAPPTSPATSAPVTVPVLATDAAPVVTPDEAVPATGLIRVFELQNGCCLEEGSCGLLEVIDAENETVGERLSRGDQALISGPPAAGVDSQFLARYPDVALFGGEYIVVMTVHDTISLCGGAASVGQLPVLHECSTVVVVEPGQELELGVAWSIFDGCQDFGPAADVLPEAS